MKFEEIADSRAMRIAAAAAIALLLASEFTIMFGPGDLLIHGSLALLGIIVSVAFALRKTWANKFFPFLCGYCAAKYSIMPAIFAVQGDPWPNFHPPIIFSIFLFCNWAWIWICFLAYSKGARWKTLLPSIAAVVGVYAFQFVVLAPKGTWKGTAQTIAADAQNSYIRGNITVGFLSAKLGIQEPEAQELLMRAPTFSALLDLPLVYEQDAAHHDLSKDEVLQTLQGYKFWDEVMDAWHKGNGANQPTIGDHAPFVEKFAVNYFFRTFYWTEANELIKQGSLSKKEIDARAKEVADKQVREILKRTGRQIE